MGFKAPEAAPPDQHMRPTEPLQAPCPWHGVQHPPREPLHGEIHARRRREERWGIQQKALYTKRTNPMPSQDCPLGRPLSYDPHDRIYRIATRSAVPLSPDAHAPEERRLKGQSIQLRTPAQGS